jgi:hypothetical protein
MVKFLKFMMLRRAPLCRFLRHNAVALIVCHISLFISIHYGKITITFPGEEKMVSET